MSNWMQAAILHLSLWLECILGSRLVLPKSGNLTLNRLCYVIWSLSTFVSAKTRPWVFYKFDLQYILNWQSPENRFPFISIIVFLILFNTLFPQNIFWKTFWKQRLCHWVLLAEMSLKEWLFCNLSYLFITAGSYCVALYMFLCWIVWFLLKQNLNSSHNENLLQM